jgi:hypothetical protein
LLSFADIGGIETKIGPSRARDIGHLDE